MPRANSSSPPIGRRSSRRLLSWGCPLIFKTFQIEMDSLDGLWVLTHIRASASSTWHRCHKSTKWNVFCHWFFSRVFFERIQKTMPQQFYYFMNPKQFLWNLSTRPNKLKRDKKCCDVPCLAIGLTGKTLRLFRPGRLVLLKGLSNIPWKKW